MMNKEEIVILIEWAKKALENSYSPYSNFKVGAALLSEDGEIFGGSNIENVSFSATNCAERSAFFSAISKGVRKFKAIAIVALDTKGEECMSFPCGVCRQVMLEFCSKDFPVVVAKNEKDYKIYRLEELMPYSFGPEYLK